jgi:nitronate monooxygenase
VSVGTIALVPRVVRAVSVPVIAAGGIVDGRGLVAALALGAAGVLMGTRFVATQESGAPPFYKQALLSAQDNETTLTDAFTGLWARVLRNDFSEDYRASGAPTLPPLVQLAGARDVFAAASARSDRRYYPLYAGQGAGGFRDVVSASEVVRRTMDEASGLVEGLWRLRSTDSRGTSF